MDYYLIVFCWLIYLVQIFECRSDIFKSGPWFQLGFFVVCKWLPLPIKGLLFKLNPGQDLWSHLKVITESISINMEKQFQMQLQKHSISIEMCVQQTQEKTHRLYVFLKYIVLQILKHTHTTPTHTSADHCWNLRPGLNAFTPFQRLSEANSTPQAAP